MPRKATGQIVERGGKPYVRATFPDKSRRLLPLTVGAKPEQLAAEARILAHAARAGKIQLVAKVEPAPAYETVSEWWARLLKTKESKGHKTVADMRGRFKNWIEPVIGRLAMHAVKAEDLRRVVAKLDAAIADETIKAKTARNVWGEVTGAFREACASKRDDLRIRADNPTDKITGPEDGAEREGPVLYPDEFMQLVSCEAVPLARRRYYVAAVYVGPRSNEIAAITAASLDLAHLTLTIDKQRDRKTNEDRETKTKRTRTFPIEPAAVAFFRMLAAERSEGRLFDMPADELRAKLLREDLGTAGLVRPALYHDDATRHGLWLHDLRHTSLVWMAMRGDDHLRIQFRGGHSDMTTTQRYIAHARNLPGGIGEPFPALPDTVEKAPEKAPSAVEPQESQVFPAVLGGVPNGIRNRFTAPPVTPGPLSSDNSGVVGCLSDPKGTGNGTEIVPIQPLRLSAEAIREATDAGALRDAVDLAKAGDEPAVLAILSDLARRGGGAS